MNQTKILALLIGALLVSVAVRGPATLKQLSLKMLSSAADGFN